MWLRALRTDGGVRIEVRDDGPGIAPEYQPRLFEKFYRVPGSEPGGAGLGLSIVRDVVEAHGGRVGVGATRSGRGVLDRASGRQTAVGEAEASA